MPAKPATRSPAATGRVLACSASILSGSVPRFNVGTALCSAHAPPYTKPTTRVPAADGDQNIGRIPGLFPRTIRRCYEFDDEKCRQNPFRYSGLGETPSSIQAGALDRPNRNRVEYSDPGSNRGFRHTRTVAQGDKRRGISKNISLDNRVEPRRSGRASAGTRASYGCHGG